MNIDEIGSLWILLKGIGEATGELLDNHAAEATGHNRRCP